MTYSIVARDPESGELGMAVHSRVFGVGRALHHVRGGVGAVNSQAMALPAHATRTLDGIAAGATAAEALEDSLSRDDARERRQVIAIDVAGGTAAHTGSACIASAGHHVGPDWVVAGNILADDGVVEAMVAAAERDTDRSLPRLLLEVLQAAEAAGGDARGSQSAAMLVAGPDHTGDPLVDRVVDLRIDDHVAPVTELGRLLARAEAGHVFERAERLLGDGEPGRAAELFGEALDAVDRDPEFVVWTALSLAGAGDEAGARDLVATLHDHPDVARWQDFTHRLAAAGMVDPDTATTWWT
ncbi:DUF1028 domain-containing protein [Salsipaludibacter albus]|uniref:DUF1028 domain-containing protein n=1 Tax=Salsipaludibacter albus TaxID=2849650 RepID=UPI001EE49EE5|nr:DUF1028 domain-containing protein [Salsipaludibacter albus]MBY5161148.1 DUF1028 domain-containing protein [Salsipaludibacter albus]